MKAKEFLTVTVLILLGILMFRVLFSFVGAVVGLTFMLVASFGVILFILGIIILGYTRTGFIPAALIGLAGVVLLGLALPVLAPLFFIALAVAAFVLIRKKGGKSY